MFCSNCGKQNLDGVKFCSGCGAPMQAETPVAPVQAAPVNTVVTPPVVQEVPVQAAPVQPVYQAPVQQPVYQAPVQEPVYQASASVPEQPAPKKSKAKLIVAIIAIVVVIGLVAGGIFLFGDKLGITGGDKEGSSQNDNNGGNNTNNGNSGNNGNTGNNGNSGNSGNGNISNNVNSKNTPEYIARKYAESSLGYDAASLVDCMSDFSLKQFAERFFETDEIDKNAIIAELESTIPDEKSTFTIVSVSIDEEWDESEELMNDLAEYDSAYVQRVSDVKQVKIEYILNGEEDSDVVQCVKEDGIWKVLG